MEICEECCIQDLEFDFSHIGVCDLCHEEKQVISTYVFEDEIDKLYYCELGGEG
ncbi:MAG: hypothetical protein HOE90_00630 [Bacteriovoracaceae bacterium]|jgi:hypothetical protein|nr:hypothetical protein [Bacteriovoracaceae bacterium]